MEITIKEFLKQYDINKDSVFTTYKNHIITDINDKSEGSENIFMFCARKNIIDMLKFFLDKYPKYDPQEKNDKGENIFMISASKKDTSILNFLLHRYPEFDQNVKNNDNETILDIFLDYEHEKKDETEQIINKLINVDPNNVTKYNKTSFFSLLDFDSNFFIKFYEKYGINNLKHQTNKGNDILMESLNEKQDAIINHLLLKEDDIDFNLENKDGYNSISIAIKNSNFKILDLFKNFLVEKKKLSENQINEIIEKSKQKILFNDYDKNVPKTIPKDFYDYFENYIETGTLNVDYEPCIISEPDCEVYIIGDLEGDYNLLYNWLLSKKFINEDLQWIAREKVFIIQCGDQLDNGRSSNYQYRDKDGNPQNTFLPKLSFFNRKNINKYKYYTHDIFLMLFMDYLSIISKNHVLSILGNHEIMNIEKYFTYVNLSMFKSEAEKKLDINTIVKNLDKTLPDNLDNITEYLKERKDFFLHNGKYAKIIRRRNFIILFNNLIISHAGLLNSFISETNTYFKISDKTGLEKYIENINNQIRIRSNWIPKIDFDNNSTIAILNLNPKKLYNDYEKEYMVNDYTEIFKKINSNSQSFSPIWNRFCVLKNINRLREQFIENYIYVLGHNSEDKINYIDEKKLKFILTDCGRHGKEYPYLEICNIVYSENKSFYNITKINNETFSLEKNYEDALKIINQKLNTQKYDFENTYERPVKKQRTADGKRRQSKRKQSKRRQSKRKQSKRRQSKRKQSKSNLKTKIY